MNKPLQNIDKIFRTHLYHYHEEAPENAWDFIKDELNKNDTALYKSKYLLLKKLFICFIFISVFILLTNTFYPVEHTFNFTEAVNKNQKVPAGLSALNPRRINLNKHTVNKFAQAQKPNNNASQTKKNEEPQFLFLPRNINYQKDLAKLISTESSSINQLKNLDVVETKKPAEHCTNLKTDRVMQAEITLHTIKTNPAFYLLPYLSFDHVTSHIKKDFPSANLTSQDYNNEKLDPAYTAGLMAERAYSKKISLRIGMLYSKWYASVSPSVVTALQQNAGAYKFTLSTNYGYADIKKASSINTQYGDSLKITSGTVNLQSLSVPLLAMVNLKPGKLKLNAQLGGAINIITSDAAELEYISKDKKETETVERLHGLRRTYFSVITGAEAVCTINKKIDAGLNPVLRYAVMPVNKNTPVKNRPLSLGAGISLHIRL